MQRLLCGVEFADIDFRYGSGGGGRTPEAAGTLAAYSGRPEAEIGCLALT